MLRISRFKSRELLLLCLLCGLARAGRAQSRRLQRLEAELAQQPALTLARARALWALAW